MTEFFFWLLAATAFVQDLRTRWFSAFWLIPCGLFLALAPWQIGPSLVFCLLVLGLRLFRPDWLGWADVAAFFFLSLLAGEQLYVVTVFACLCGLVWKAVSGCELIPFVSCLVLGTLWLAAVS